MTGLHQRLDNLCLTYRRSSPYDNYIRTYTFEVLKRYLNRPRSTALELGCSDGRMTEMIASCVPELHVVEGSHRFLEEAKRRNLPNVSFTHSVFEEYEPACKYDYIFATFVLTHIADLTQFFNKVASWLAPEGRLLIAVPNARVISRQLGRQMSLIDDLFSLSENDRHHGHHRAYDRVRLNRDIEAHGFVIEAQGGFMLKPLADFQMDQLIDHGILGGAELDALSRLGMAYPDLAALIFAVCRKS